MSVSAVTARLITMSKGDNMWLSRRLTVKSKAELNELEQELKAVHNMYMQGYIGNSQLCKLEHTIVNETASVKPRIRTKSTRSVSQLAQRFESKLQKESHDKAKQSAIIKLRGNVSERIQKYELRCR